MNFDLFTKHRAFREDDLLGSCGAHSACREVVWPACSDSVCHSQPEQMRRSRLKHKRVQPLLRPGCPGRSELTALLAWSSCSSDVVFALQFAGTHPSCPFHLLSRFPKACELGTLCLRIKVDFSEWWNGPPPCVTWEWVVWILWAQRLV